MVCASQTPPLVNYPGDSGDCSEDSDDCPGEGGWVSWGCWVTILLMVGDYPGDGM